MFAGSRKMWVVGIMITLLAITAYYAVPLFIKLYKNYRTDPAEKTKAAPERLAQMTPEQQREYLATLYRTLIHREKPDLISLKTYAEKWGSGKGQYIIYAEHPYLTRYWFSLSPMARRVEYWIAINNDALKKAGVVRVGVRPDPSKAGVVFPVK